MNYDGFRFDGVATAITMVNDKAYANRDAALADNTGAVTYSYCHFYASSLAVAGSTDVLWVSGPGPTAGAGNIAADVAPAVQAWARYPAEVTLTVDDAGMTVGADTYYAGTVLPIADSAGVPVGAAITVGYTARITPIVAEIQGWIDAGRDVTFAFGVAYVLHEYERFGYSVHGKRNGGDAFDQRESFDDYGYWRERRRDLQPGAGTGGGNDPGTARGAGGHGQVYRVGGDTLPGAVWDGMFGVHGRGAAGAGSGGREHAGCEEFDLCDATGCDAADDGRTHAVAGVDDGESYGTGADAGVCVSGRI